MLKQCPGEVGSGSPQEHAPTKIYRASREAPEGIDSMKPVGSNALAGIYVNAVAHKKPRSRKKAQHWRAPRERLAILEPEGAAFWLSARALVS